MAKLVVLGLFLAASQAAARSATAVVTDGRVGVGLITGGDFGPGSFSIGADGRNPDQAIPHIGPNANAQGAIINGEIPTGKSGQGGRGGGQIIIGTVSTPSHKESNNKQRSHNIHVKDNVESNSEEFMDSWENDVFSSDFFKKPKNPISKPTGNKRGTNQNNFHGEKGNGRGPNTNVKTQDTAPLLNKSPLKNGPSTGSENGQYASNNGPSITVGSIRGQYDLNNGPSKGANGQQSTGAANGQYALNYGQSTGAANGQHNTNTMYNSYTKSNHEGDESSWVWA